METHRTYWQLRYRSPLSPTKGVDDVIIETETEDPDAARQLADWYLATKVASPSTRFVYVRRLVVATAAEMRQAVPVAAVKETEDKHLGGANPAQAASRADIPDDVRAQQPTTGSGARGRVGA